MLLPLIILCVAALVPAAEVTPAELASFEAPLKKNLTENILKFWYPRSVDNTSGGYLMAFDAQGRPRERNTKMIVTQARMVWFFANLVRNGHGGKEHVAAAETGFRFLRDKMWDKEHGGFYWEVDSTGAQVMRPYKHLYGQAFALYALSEYYLATNRKDILELAAKLFDVMEKRSHDSRYGGYNEWFARDWSPAPASETPYMGGGTGNVKLMNTHLHLMEAMTTYYRASKSPVARERLMELIAIESSAVVRKGLTACTDKYDRNWTPRLDNNWARVSYGHDVENIWLIADALEAAGQPTHPYVDLFRNLFAYSRKYGYDEGNGGFYDSGAFHKPADNRGKVWWTQAEALVSSLKMYQLTGDSAYFDVFRKTFEFVDRHQTDWQNGEWHSTVTEEMKGTGDKGQNWKGAYHNGRAMMECLRILRQLQSFRQ